MAALDEQETKLMLAMRDRIDQVETCSTCHHGMNGGPASTWLEHGMPAST